MDDSSMIKKGTPMATCSNEEEEEESLLRNLVFNPFLLNPFWMEHDQANYLKKNDEEIRYGCGDGKLSYCSVGIFYQERGIEFLRRCFFLEKSKNCRNFIPCSWICLNSGVGWN